MSTEIYTVHQAAIRLGLHPKTVLRCVHDGRLRATRIGKAYRITASDLDAFSGADKAQPEQIGTARVTAMVEIDSVSREAAERLATGLSAGGLGREARPGHLSFGTSYEPREQRFRIMINGDPARAASLLHLIEMYRERL